MVGTSNTSVPEVAIDYLVGGLEPWNFMTFRIQLGMSSSQLTKSIIFQDGRSTTNQLQWPYYGNIAISDGRSTTNQINIPLTSHEYLILIPMISHY